MSQFLASVLLPRYCDYKIRKLLRNQREESICLLPTANDGVRTLLCGVSFSSESALFSKTNTCRGMAKETLKKIVSPEGKTI